MAKIKFVDSEKIKDSRGDDTIRVSVTLEDGTSASAGVPAGKSRGGFEARPLSADRAMESIKDHIGPALLGVEAVGQEKIDGLLTELDGTLDKSNIGANAILGASMACARVSSLSKGMPLWRYLRELFGESGRPKKAPRIFVNVIEGGLHAENNLDFQEYLIIPKSERAGISFQEAREVFEKTGEIIIKKFGGKTKIGDEGGFAPDFRDSSEPFEILAEAAEECGISVNFGLDAAANNVDLDKKALTDKYDEFRRRFNLWYLEDPFSEHCLEEFAELQEKFYPEVMVAGDDLTVTNTARMKKAKEAGSITGVIIKPNQIGTVSETLQAIKQAKEWGWKVIISHRSGETMDDFIADLAYGVGADGLKSGAPTQPERFAKYRRLAEIEEITDEKIK